MARVYLVSVLLWALVPLQGFAQPLPPPPLVPASSSPEADPYDPKGEPSEGSPDGGYEEDEPPRGELIPHRLEPSGERGAVPRIALESLAGIGLGVVGGITGSLYFLSFAFCDDCDVSTTSVFLALGLAATGLSSGVALGVRVGGGLMGGEGRFLPTLLGATVGLLVGVAAAFPLGAVFDGGWLPPLLAFPVTGAIIAYELSHSNVLESRAAAGTQVSWIPVISVRPSGGLVAGLAGNF